MEAPELDRLRLYSDPSVSELEAASADIFSNISITFPSCSDWQPLWMFCTRSFNIFRDKCLPPWLAMIDWLYFPHTWAASSHNLRLTKTETVWEADININLWISPDVKNTYISVPWIPASNISIWKKKNYFHTFDKEMYEWISSLVRILQYKYHLFGIPSIVWPLAVLVGGRAGLIWFCSMSI